MIRYISLTQRTQRQFGVLCIVFDQQYLDGFCVAHD
jgi:hypothetical protein